MEARAPKVLESTAIRATFWTVTDYGVSMALRVLNSLILTRLLMPETFGLLTLVLTIVVGISLLSDIGLGPSVIQSRRGDDPDFLNTVWTVQVLRGVGIFLIALVLAWPMSLIYKDPRVVPLVIALGFTVIITAGNSTNLLSLSRHMGVRRLFIFDTSSQVLTCVVTVAWALLVGRTVWALVAGCYANEIYRLIASHYKPFVPGIRNRFHWDKESARNLVHFGKWILLGTACFFFASQSDRLIIGKLVGFSMLGVYGIAYSISDIPRAIINAFSQKVGYPFISKMAHLPKPEFRKLFLRYRFRALMAGAFLLCMTVYVGGFLITKVYDHRYHEAAWMVPVLALGLWHTLMAATTLPALYSLGKSQYTAIGNVFYCVVAVTSIPLGFHFFGMFGAVVAVAAADLPVYIIMLIGASRQGVSTWRQDLLATSIYLCFLGAGFAVRHAIVS